MAAIYLRELKAYFKTSLGYIFCAMFLAASGLLFAITTLLDKSTSSLPEYFMFLMFLFCIMLPLLTMRLFSDEKSTKSEQLLLTSPVSLPGMVLGKYFSALTVFTVCLLVNSLNFFLLAKYGNPNVAMIMTNIFGIFLVGAAIIAVGVFFSSLTENQLNAAVAAIVFTAISIGLSFVSELIPFEWIRTILNWFSIYNRYAPFANSMFDFTAILYYISFAVIFVFLTVRVFEKRRWS